MQWRLVTFEVVGGMILLRTVCWVTRGDLTKLEDSFPIVGAVQLHLVCIKILAAWSVVVVAVLLPIYLTGCTA